MPLSELPIVCKFCREPLQYRAGFLMEVATGRRHFTDDICPVVWGIDRVTRKVAQGGRKVSP